MTKTKSKFHSPPVGIFHPGDDMNDYLDYRGDLRSVFDPVHAHFFDHVVEADPLTEGRRLTKKRSSSFPPLHR